MFEGLGKAITSLFFVTAVAVPLALWKVIEIVVWVIKHVRISFDGGNQ